MTQAWDFVDARILWSQQPQRLLILDQQICQLDLSPRTKNALLNQLRASEDGQAFSFHHPISTVGELIIWSEAELLCLHGFGRKCLNEVKQFLDLRGLHLGTGR